MTCRSCPGPGRCRCRDPTSFQQLNDAIRAKYKELTRTGQLELKMADNKSFFDNIFDVADRALGGVESVLLPAEPETTASQKQSDPSGRPPGWPHRPSDDDAIDAESVEVRQEDWEATWQHDHYWAQAGAPNSLGEAQHVFAEASLRASCGQQFQSHEIRNRQKLVHGKRIVACTSCIIAVSRRGL